MNQDWGGGGLGRAAVGVRPGSRLAAGPMTFTDILDGAFQLYRSAGGTILALGLIVLVPVQLLVAFLQRGALGNSLAGVLEDPSAAEALLTGTDLASTAIGFAVTQGLILPLLSGGYIAVARVVVHGDAPGLDAAWTALRRHGLSLLGAWWLHLLALLLPMAPALLFVVTGSASVPLAVILFPIAAFGTLGLLPVFMVVAPAIIVEGIGPVAAIRRSAALVRRRYAATFGTLVGTSFVIGLLATIISGVPQAGALTGGFGFAWVLLAIATTVGELISTPLTANVALLTFLDARVRVEGYDLTNRARAMRAGEIQPGRYPIGR